MFHVTQFSTRQQALSKSAGKEYKCRACGAQFQVLGDLQTHILIEHHQKGDIPDKKAA